MSDQSTPGRCWTVWRGRCARPGRRPAASAPADPDRRRYRHRHQARPGPGSTRYADRPQTRWCAFSTIAKDPDGFRLVTPVEKMKMPSRTRRYAVRIDRVGEAYLVRGQHVDDEVEAGPDNAICVDADALAGEPRPICTMRRGLEARCPPAGVLETDRDGTRSTRTPDGPLLRRLGPTAGPGSSRALAGAPSVTPAEKTAIVTVADPIPRIPTIPCYAAVLRSRARWRNAWRCGAQVRRRTRAWLGTRPAQRCWHPQADTLRPRSQVAFPGRSRSWRDPWRLACAEARRRLASTPAITLAEPLHALPGSCPVRHHPGGRPADRHPPGGPIRTRWRTSSRRRSTC